MAPISIGTASDQFKRGYINLEGYMKNAEPLAWVRRVINLPWIWWWLELQKPRYPL
jgi:hypothetical protein